MMLAADVLDVDVAERRLPACRLRASSFLAPTALISSSGYGYAPNGVEHVAALLDVLERRDVEVAGGERRTDRPRSIGVAARRVAGALLHEDRLDVALVERAPRRRVAARGERRPRDRPARRDGPCAAPWSSWYPIPRSQKRRRAALSRRGSDHDPGCTSPARLCELQRTCTSAQLTRARPSRSSARGRSCRSSPASSASRDAAEPSLPSAHAALRRTIGSRIARPRAPRARREPVRVAMRTDDGGRLGAHGRVGVAEQRDDRRRARSGRGCRATRARPRRGRSRRVSVIAAASTLVAADVRHVARRRGRSRASPRRQVRRA